MSLQKKAPKKAGKPSPPAKKKAPVKTAVAAKKVASKKAATKKTAPTKPAKKAAPKKAASKTGFNAPLTASPALAEVIGNQPLARTEIIKKIWDYIKKNNLQDKTNKRMINADAKLKTLFGGKSQVSMFDVAGIVAKNVK